jgi:hypothetical protein
MLPVRIFRTVRFSAASVAIASAFFALFGFIFLITQYFQLVRGYRPLGAGVRTLPVATAESVGASQFVAAAGSLFAARYLPARAGGEAVDPEGSVQASATRASADLAPAPATSPTR